jgi:hypothetical protein
MSRRVARRLADRGRLESAERFERQAKVAESQASELKAILDDFATATEEAAAPLPG